MLAPGFYLALRKESGTTGSVAFLAFCANTYFGTTQWKPPVGRIQCTESVNCVPGLRLQYLGSQRAKKSYSLGGKEIVELYYFNYQS